MGTNSLPIDHRMKYQILLLASTLALLVAEAQANNKKDVKCKNKSGSFTEKTITLNAKETLKFETRGNKYNPDLSCAVEYVLGSCKQASISCPKFKVSKDNGIDGCTDALIVMFNGDEKRYCGADGPDENGDDTDGGDETKKCNCGLASRKKRIVGGKETEVSEYPWQIGMVHTGKSNVWCGGSVISDQW